MVVLNLEEVYEIIAVNLNSSILIAEFDAPQIGGICICLHVKLSPHSDPFLTNVYNLCFGPIGVDGEINDKIRLKHENVGKVLSTAIFIAYGFLVDHPEFTIGIDGSNEIRANLYHSMFLLNREQLADFFVCVGVDWYVKLMWNGLDIERDVEGHPVFKPKIESFDYSRNRNELYGYYMFSLK